jgi:hypothetical protein
MSNVLFYLTNVLGVVLLAIAGLFLCLEFYHRIKNWFGTTFLYEDVKRRDFLAPEYHSYLEWIEDWDKPMFQYLPVAIRHYNLDNPIPPVTNNSLGFRCDEFSEPDPDELRIIVLGGSAAWGFGASSNAATIGGRLESMFNETPELLQGCKRAKCYNLAQVDGHQTQDLVTLVLYAEKIRPQIVVSFTGWNEVVCNSTMKLNLLQKYGVFYITEMEGWQPIKAGRNALAKLKESFLVWAGRKSALISALARSGNKGISIAQRPIDECVEVARPMVIDHLIRLERLAKGFGFNHYQFFQPNLYRKKKPTDSEAKVMSLYDDIRPIQGGRETGDFLRENNVYDDIIKECASTADIVSVTDLSDIFREESERMFYSLVHCSDDGYQRIAREMINVIADKELASK